MSSLWAATHTAILLAKSCGTLFSENGKILPLSSCLRPFIGMRIERSITVSGNGFSDAKALGQKTLYSRTPSLKARGTTPVNFEKPALATARRQLLFAGRLRRGLTLDGLGRLF